MGRCFHRLDGVLMPLLLLLSLGHACTVFDLDPDDPSSSKGHLVPMSTHSGESAVELLIKRPAHSRDRRKGHFGIYFQNEHQQDVAGVRVMYLKDVTLVYFEGRRGGDELEVVQASYVNGSFFTDVEWVQFYVMYENGLFEVRFPTLYKNANPLKYDYPLANGTENPWPLNQLYAWVSSDHELPLMMYPVALSGPKQRMNYRCLDNYEFERKSTNFVEHGRSIRHGDVIMFMKPESDFEVGTLLLQSKGSSQQLQISKEDIVIGQYNPISITSDWDGRTVTHMKERRCLNQTVMRSLYDLESISFISNSNAKWIFRPERSFHGFLPCEEEIKDCHDLTLVFDGKPTDSERKWPGSDTQLKKHPKAEDDHHKADFSIWFQEVDLTVAGVRVREVGLDLVLEFYQVVNGTSYVLQKTVTLEGFQLRSDTWTPLMTKIEEDYIEVGFEGDRWFTARGEMTLDHQMSLMTFRLSSKKPLLVRYNCGEEPPSEGPEAPKTKVPERLSFAKAKFPSHRTKAEALFRPVAGFKTASLFVMDASRRNIFRIGDITEDDVVMDKWNVIKFSQPPEFGHLPSVQPPSGGNYSVAWRIAHPLFVDAKDQQPRDREILFYSNVPIEWMLDDLSEQEKMIIRPFNSYRHPLRSVCTVRVIGRDAFTPLRYEEGMTFRLRSPNYHKFGLLVNLRDFEGRSHDIEFRRQNGFFHVFSESLYINETFPDMTRHLLDGVRVSLGGLSEDGLLEVSLESIIDGMREEHKLRARSYYIGNVTNTWINLFPLSEEMSLEAPGHFSENITKTPMQTRTMHVLKDTKLFVAFRSRLLGDHITSISLSLYNKDWEEIRNITLTYGRNLSYITHSWNRKPVHLNLNLVSTSWVEMVIKTNGRHLTVGVRNSSDEDFRNEEIDIYQEAYFVAIESMRSHEIMVNCKRDDNQMVLETGRPGTHPLITPSQRFVALKKLNEINIPATGTGDVPSSEQKCSLIFVSYYDVSLGVVYFHHRNQKVSTMFFNGTSFGRLNAMVLRNPGEENDVAMVTLPSVVGLGTLRGKALQHKSPVDRVTVYTDLPALWITPDCTCSQEELSLPRLPANCYFLNSTEAKEPFTTSRPAPAGDFLVFLEHSSPQPVALVHLVHASGEVSTRDLAGGHFLEKTTWFQVRNALEEDDFAYVKFVGDLGPDFVKLKNKAPVKELRFISPSGIVCVSVASVSCQ